MPILDTIGLVYTSAIFFNKYNTEIKDIIKLSNQKVNAGIIKQTPGDYSL